MNPWLSAVLALTSALVGGLVAAVASTRMRIHHERDESLRARMIEAADDFAQKAFEALNSLHRLVHTVEPEDLEIDEEIFNEIKSHAELMFEAPLAEARPLVEETRVRLARVHLLFGSQTSSGRAATSLVADMWHAFEVIGDEPGIPDVSVARQAFVDAQGGYEQFAFAAREAIRQPDLWVKAAGPAPSQQS